MSEDDHVNTGDLIRHGRDRRPCGSGDIAHLHFETRFKGHAINPANYLTKSIIIQIEEKISATDDQQNR